MQRIIETIQLFTTKGTPMNGLDNLFVYILLLSLGAIVMVIWMSLMAIAWTYGERRIAGFLQGRLGPNRVGPEGILQPIADGIKLLTKEDIIPSIAYRNLYIMGPFLVFVGTLLPFAALPFSDRLYVVNMELALYYILAFEAIEVVGVLMVGWAPGSKWSLYGGMRLAAQMLAYEIPMGLAVMVVIILSGSMNLIEIVKWQSSPFLGITTPWIFGWSIFRSPAALIAFLIFFIGGFAATKRAPFDLPEAESELVAGYHTEYSGIRFAFFFLAEYASMYLICGLAAILFLGGWVGPIPRPTLHEDYSLIQNWFELVLTQPNAGNLASYFSGLIKIWTNSNFWIWVVNQGIGVVNLLLKAFSLYFVMIWVRWTLPRIRVDQVLHLCLKILLPFSLTCIVFALLQVLIWY